MFYYRLIKSANILGFTVETHICLNEISKWDDAKPACVKVDAMSRLY